MHGRRLLTAWLVGAAVLAGPALAAAQCATERANLDSPDREYVGLRAGGQRSWVGQQFTTDCDGKFLTVSFLVDVQLFEADGVRNLTAGDALTCTVMDDQNRPIASLDHTLTQVFGLEWVDFDFGR